MAVEHVFNTLKIPYKKVELGEVEIIDELYSEQYQTLMNELKNLGFEIIDNRKSRIIEQVKNNIIKLIHHSDISLNVNLSDYITSSVNYEYKYLSTLFSEVEGITIEKFYIAQKIERVKELIVYDELSLNEIADKLGYSSAAYLSNQFKKHTGLTPGHFRRIKDSRRKPIDML